MAKILRNILKKMILNNNTVNKRSYFGGGLLKGLPFEDGGFVPNSGEIKKRALIKKLMELDKPIKEKPLFPHLIGDDQKGELLRDWQFTFKEGTDMHDLWFDKEHIVMHDGKPYIFTGNDIIGNISPKGKWRDRPFEMADTFVAKNPDNPEDHIIVQWRTGNPLYFLEHGLMGNYNPETLVKDPNFMPDTLSVDVDAHQLRIRDFKLEDIHE